ncbi:hypothetical protein H1S01_13180 [Heliobacterium chlorum]|uniref:Uncharacterized protein n=1 Tax=Heliobacterium chlorum TaxID=2698 RepID=A0ABR7T3W3_HELCL|nr:hypothetical protein [Heliobacterium chlorum]MBC9785459.1 hypothetical protein [Heliobacterium chlorum]
MHYRYRRSPTCSNFRHSKMMPYLFAGWLGIVLWYLSQVSIMTEAVTDIRDALHRRRR